MHVRFLGLTVVATAMVVACSSSSEGGGEVTPEVAFCNAVTASLTKCAGTSTSCAAITTDCSKLTSLLSPSLLAAATACMKTSTCDGGGPLACLGSSLGSVTATSAQQTFAADYCEQCSVVSGEACTTAFYPADGVPGVGTLLLPFGDSLVNSVDGDCTSSSLGKTVCQSSFTTCVSASAIKALATTLSADSASCLVTSIQAGIAKIGSGGDGGTSEGGGPATGDGGPAAACNDVPNIAPIVVIENVTGTVPAAVGGKIADGTYVLLSVRNYGTPFVETTIKETMVFSNGTQVDDVYLLEGDTSPTTESAVFTAAGTSYTRSFTCPASDTRVRSYSATDKTFTLVVDKAIYQFVKQ